MNTILDSSEVEQITGYKRQAEQLAELHRQGFHRARRSPTTGRIILERDHYTAICNGARPAKEPNVKVPLLRTA